MEERTAVLVPLDFHLPFQAFFHALPKLKFPLLMPLQAEQAPRLPKPNRHADGEAEQAPRLPNPNCRYDSEAERAPRSPNPNRHLHGEAERAPRLLNPNCHDDSEAHRAPRLPNLTAIVAVKVRVCPLSRKCDFLPLSVPENKGCFPMLHYTSSRIR